MTFGRNNSKHVSRTGWKAALTILVVVCIAGCGDTIGYKYGDRPDTELLETRLRLGSSTKSDVRAALGKPVGGGDFMLPVIDATPRETWTYYYEVGSIGAGKTQARLVQDRIRWETGRLFLFVYFDKEKYDGYLWFSSLPQ